MATREQQAAALQMEWSSNPRWKGIARRYTACDVVRLRGSLKIEHTLAQRGAEKLWELLNREPFVSALGAQTGSQAMQQVRAGLRAIHLSCETPLDQPPYPADPAPAAVHRINSTLQQADQQQWSEGSSEIDFFVPIVADAEAGSGGALNTYQLTKAMIEAGVAGVHLGDLLACGGKVLVPTREAVEKLAAARLAADVMGTPTLLVARTDAAADLLSSDVDGNDQPFCTGERTVEGFYKVRPGLDQAVARALAYAPYADLVCCETGKPDLVFAKRFADAVHDKFPGKMLAYNCSPSFNWKKHLDDATIAKFQKELGAMGYAFQFVTQAGFHALNYGMFNLAHGYARRQMPAFVELQEAEFAAAAKGFAPGRHQREVGAGYVDAVARAIRQCRNPIAALHGSHEDERCFDPPQKVA
ncbi:isocitrate lyase [Massilia sp. Root351]|uniref:isocitrate lyase n=1 Tax=Massilia sp. Root351 TaxID=1736522 RepID=UPI0007090848|nr:isocitrate lyase [Massilia sp. Root351]KQV79893.1 isocitrate lyase [Massilia sp. Root351]